MKKTIPILTTLFSLALGVNTLYAVNGTWNVNNGNWSDATKWAGGIIADGAGSTASYAKPGSGGTFAVTNDVSRTIGGVANADSSGLNIGTFIIESSGGSILTLSGGGTQLRSVLGTLVVNVVVDGTAGVNFNFKPVGVSATTILGAANIYSGNTFLLNQYAASSGPNFDPT